MKLNINIIVISILIILIPACANKYYSGPVTDNFDGNKFRYNEDIKAKSLFTVLKWRLTRDTT
jgi:hypothetical protein